MNDNKKWSKRAGVLFWWTIACLPVICYLGIIIGNIVASNQTGTFNTFITTTQNATFCTTFNTFCISYLTNSITDLLVDIGIPNISDSILVCPVIPILAWFIQTWLLHIVVDFILILPKVCQKLIDKVCD